MLKRSLLITLLLAPLATLHAADAPQARLDDKHRVFFKDYCVECHNEKKPKGKLRLDDISFTLDSVENADRWQKILNQINSGEMPPEDSKQPQMGVNTDFVHGHSSETCFFARPSREENLAVVPTLRKNHAALWNIAVEPKTSHGPGEKTWPLVFSFLRHTFAARVPANTDARQGPVKLNALALEAGHLGQNWDSTKGGYQTLTTAPFANFADDKATASWLVNASYAADWRKFQGTGEIKPTH